MIVELTENMIQDAFAKTGIDQKYYPQYEAEAKRRYKAYQEVEPDNGIHHSKKAMCSTAWTIRTIILDVM